MKIGIITFHRAENFGAVLQCFALQTFLCSLGYDVEIIDYQAEAIRKTYKIVDFSIFKSHYNINTKVRTFLGRLKNILSRLEKKKAYAEFRNTYLLLSSPISNVNNLPSDIDAFIVGSDQMWNIALTGGFDDVYFLNRKFKAPKISYAVSSEKWSYDSFANKSKEISTLIDDFSYLSVREIDFKNELQKYTRKQIQVCVDPSFLLKKNDYNKLLTKPRCSSYVLTYHLVDSPVMSDIAEQMAHKSNKNLIEIHAGFNKYSNKKRHKSNVGPTELLGYIANADVVFTTSFHGLVFSIIFEKQFWVIDNGGNTRQKNLLAQLGLTSRIVKCINDIHDKDLIDYSHVNPKLKSFVTDSVNYLKESLICK